MSNLEQRIINNKVRQAFTLLKKVEKKKYETSLFSGFIDDARCLLSLTSFAIGRFNDIENCIQVTTSCQIGQTSRYTIYQANITCNFIEQFDEATLFCLVSDKSKLKCATTELNEKFKNWDESQTDYSDDKKWIFLPGRGFCTWYSTDQLHSVFYNNIQASIPECFKEGQISDTHETCVLALYETLEIFFVKALYEKAQEISTNPSSIIG